MLKTHLTPIRSNNRRNGIALIFVLGCLAIIVIAAVSFATFMRVERLVAGQSVALARARQSALAGLDKAIERMKTVVPAAECVYDNDATITNFWPRSNFYSRGAVLATPNRILASFPSGLPSGGGSKPFFATEYFYGSTSVISTNYEHTVDTFSNDDQSGGPTGEAIAVIANVSGRIDVGALRRDPSVTRNEPGGIDISGIEATPTSTPGGLGLLPTQKNIYDARTSGLPGGKPMSDFFSMPEARYLGTTNTAYQLRGPKEHNFTFFEQACQQYLSPVFKRYTNSVYVGSAITPALLADAGYRASLTDALLAAGVPDNRPNSDKTPVATTYNLVDYLDNDFLPSSNDPTLFCGEAIPLVNELHLTATQVITTNTLTKITLKAEINFPFIRSPAFSGLPYANNTKYKLRVTSVTSTGGTISFTPTDIPVDPTGADWSFSTDEYKQVTLFTDLDIKSGLVPVDVKVVLELYESGGTLVDRIGSAATPLVFTAVVDAFNSSLEVRDGRFNYLPAEWVTPVPPIGTMGAMNTTMTTRPEAMAEYPYFVKNAPMASACELGYIALGDRAWQSLALVEDTSLPAAGNPTVHRVLDTFTVHLGNEFDGQPVLATTLNARTGRAGPLVRGLVNLNTDKPDVLATAFLNGIVNERCPGDTAGTSTINWASAKAFANLIVNARRAYPAPRNSFIRKSDVGEVCRPAGVPSWNVPGTENQKEALLRQFMDLCDVRGNTFVVAVRGIGLVGGTRSSAVELVAHVWRDPLTRRVQIRSIKWVGIDDDLITPL